MDTTLLAVVFFVVVVVAVAVALWWRHAAKEEAMPLLAFDPSFTPLPAWHEEVQPREAARPARNGAAEPTADVALAEQRPREQPVREEPRPAPEPTLRVLPTREPNAAAGSLTTRGSGGLAPAAAADAFPDADGTLQLLPGRLVPLDSGQHQEIRFVRVPGNRFTLGRSAGRTHAHIQLQAPTASRMHARMVFAEGHWGISNLSETNPVVVNGAPLPLDRSLQLDDGDRIEFGELGFTFRSR